MIVFNGRAHLEECLATLSRQTRAPDEILAIDNASADGSLELIRSQYPAARTIRLRANLGYAGGCNVAARAATSDVIAFLNQDVRLDPRWLEELIAPLEADAALTAAQSLMLLYDEPDLVNTSGTTVDFLGIGWVTDYRKPAISLEQSEVPFLSGTAFAVRRADFLGLGGFDEAYGSYHEDVDLSWRMGLCGLRAELAPASRVYHKYRFAGAASKKQQLERNRLITLLKNYRGRTLALIAPALLVSELGICALAVGQGWIGAKLRSYRDLLQLWPEIRGKRAAVQGMRQVDDREMARSLAGGIEFEETNQLLVRLGSRLLAAYWWAARRLIRW